MAFRIEYNVYLVLGEQEAAKAVLRQVYTFMEQEKLMDRNTLLRWNSYADPASAMRIEKHFIPQITALGNTLQKVIALPPAMPSLLPAPISA